MEMNFENCPEQVFQYADKVKLKESLNQIAVNQSASQSVPFRTDGIAILLVKRGLMRITIDYNDYVLRENDMLIKMPEHIMQKVEAQDNFDGLALVIRKEFLDDVMSLLNKALYSPGYTQVRLYPHNKLQADEVETISKSLLLVKEKILTQGKVFTHEVIKCSVLMALLECGSIIKKSCIQPSATSRQEQIINTFWELLKDNCRKEHKVEFYANKLFVTPQYLSLVLKNASGKTAYQWIVDGIITEAKILLKDANLSILQISENLNFPDSSSFGKFFKKQTGLSPFKYRNANTETQLLF